MSRLVAACLMTSLASAPAGASEVFELNNTRPELLATEFVGSVFLGFMLPDLVVPRPPDPLTCVEAWCNPPAFDVAVSNLLTLEHPRLTGTVSHVFTMVLAPGVAIGSQIVGAAQAGKGGKAVEDVIIILDAWMLSTGLNSAAKLMGRRQRPAFYFGREDKTEVAHHPGEEFLSFYSGDTTWVWTFMAAGTTLAYLRGYEHAKVVAYTLSGLAVVGGTMRIMSDMHWATDVLLGAVIGGAVGFSVPYLLHRRRKVDRVRVHLNVDEQHAGLSISGRW